MPAERSKRRVYEILEKAAPGDRASWCFDVFLMALITANVAATMAETVAPLRDLYLPEFQIFETVSVAIFAIELLARLWSCTADPRYREPIRGRLRFLVSPFALIDLIAVLPYFLPLALAPDLRMMRVMRMLRLLRLFKMGRYSESLRILGRVVSERREHLVVTTFVGLLLLLVSSTLIYLVETEAQPEAFPSIPAAMWWGVATLTTVGYGDIYPITAIGRILGSIVAVLGIGMFALPAGILGSGFVDELERRRSTEGNSCPHCGGDLD